MTKTLKVSIDGRVRKAESYISATWKLRCSDQQMVGKDYNQKIPVHTYLDGVRMNEILHFVLVSSSISSAKRLYVGDYGIPSLCRGRGDIS